MRVGSLVIYIHNEQYNEMVTPDRNEIYTVRSVCMARSEQRPYPHTGIKLEEIVNDIAPDGMEYVYVGEHFKEIQPPVEVSEWIKKCTQQPVENKSLIPLGNTGNK